MLDWSALLGLRGAIILKLCDLMVKIHFTLLLKNLQWTSTLKGSLILVPKVLQTVFTHSTFHATWTCVCVLFSILCTSVPAPLMTDQTISSALNAILLPSFLSSPTPHIPASPQFFLIPQPEMIRPLPFCL